MPAAEELLASFPEEWRNAIEALFHRYRFTSSQKLEILKDEADLRQWKETPFYAEADYPRIDERKDGRKGDAYIIRGEARLDHPGDLRILLVPSPEMDHRLDVEAY